MKARKALPAVMPMTLVTLCNASMAAAQDASAGAGNYQEMGWLFLVLLLGFSVVARRASRLDASAKATSRNTAQTTTDSAPSAARPMRLIEKSAQESAVHVSTRTNIELSSPKKTA